MLAAEARKSQCAEGARRSGRQQDAAPGLRRKVETLLNVYSTSRNSDDTSAETAIACACICINRKLAAASVVLRLFLKGA